MVQNGILGREAGPSKPHDHHAAVVGPEVRRNIPLQLRNAQRARHARRVPGVGSVSNIGTLLRHADPRPTDKPPSRTHGQGPAGVKDQNRESAAGVLGQAPMEGIDATIPITGRLSSVE